MTQSSRPQADNYANGFDDAGPYSRDQWSQKLIIEHVGDAVTTRGPFGTYLNLLEVTNPAGVDIQVDTGAGYVNGTLLDNTAAVTFTPAAPAGNPRIDIVCLVENNTNAAVSDGTAANGWIFPNDLTDYDALNSVPAYSARLVIIKGAEAGAPVAPALDQSGTLYMVPLAQYQISVVPAVSALTDRRDYVDAVNYNYFTRLEAAWNDTDGTLITLTEGGYSSVLTLEFPDSKLCRASTFIAYPANYISGLTISALYLGISGGGNIYINTTFGAATCGEVVYDENESTGFSAEAIDATTGNYSCELPHALSIGDPGDFIFIKHTRDATNVLDTVGDAVEFVGFLVEYFGYR